MRIHSFANRVVAAFNKVFGATPARLVRVPGCITLLGEHTAHDSGLVLSTAIDKESYFAIAPNQVDRVRLFSIDKQAYHELSLTHPPVHSLVQWANLLLDVVAVLQQRGLRVRGFDCAFGSNMPVGISPSATALACGLTYALNQIFGLGLNALLLAQIAQDAEQASGEKQRGLTNHLISVVSQPDYLVHLDCRSLAHEHYSFDTQTAHFIICDSGAKPPAPNYNAHQAQYEQGVATLRQHYPDIRTLRDVTLAQLAAHYTELDPAVYRHCRYVLEENQRVKAACTLLQAGDLLSFGHLLYQSNARLRDSYQVSCPELDALVTLAQPLAGVFGARILGSNFNGYTINLVTSFQAAAFGSAIRTGFAAQFGYEPLLYTVRSVAGVNTLLLPT